MRLLIEFASNFENYIRSNRKRQRDALGHDAEDPNIAPNGKLYRLYNKAELELACFDGTSSTTTRKVVDELGVSGIGQNERGRTVYRINELDRQLIAQNRSKRWPFKRSSLQKMIVYSITTLKGGSGKSTSAVTQAAALAQELSTSYRVLFVDLDPQSTGSDILVPNRDPSGTSIGQLMQRNYKDAETISFSQAVRDSVLQTNIYGLDVIPASQRDVDFERFSKLQNNEAMKQRRAYSSHVYLQAVLDELKDDYDVVILDTHPETSDVVFAANYCATNLIIPFKPSQNDRDATSKFLDGFVNTYAAIRHLGHSGYDSIDLLPVATSRSKTEQAISTSLADLCEGHILPDLNYSEAIAKCAEHNMVIHEVSPSQYKSMYEGDRQTLLRAQRNSISIAEKIEQSMHRQWRRQSENETTQALNSYDSLSLLVDLSEKMLSLIENLKIEQKKSLHGEVGEAKSDDPNMAPNGKRYRIYNKAELESLFFEGQNTRATQRIIEQLGIDGVGKNERDATVYRVNELGKRKIAEHYGMLTEFARTPLQSMLTFLVANQKGGAGKSTFTTTTAVAIATQLSRSYRVGIIDLDPQGNTTEIMLPYRDPDSFFVGSLLCHEYELEEGDDFGEFIYDCFQETNSPNVRVLPADPKDMRFDAIAKIRSYEAQQRGEYYYPHYDLQNILDAVKDKFDIVLIDTPPRLSESVFAAHFVATDLIVPLRPSQNDFMSSAHYLQGLPETYKSLINLGHQGYNSIHFVPMGTTNSRTERRLSGRIKNLCTGHVLPDFQYSEAVNRCSNAYQTIHEISPAEYSKKLKGSKESLRTAQIESTEIAQALEQSMINTWREQQWQGEDNGF